MGDDELAKKSKASSMMAIKSRSKSKSMLNIGSTSRLKLRKQSYSFGGVPGIRPVERTSQLGIEFKRPPLAYLNTYQLEPHTMFSVPKVTQVVSAVLDEYFTGHKYSASESPIIALRIAADLMRQVKQMQFNRYRIISVVTIGQKRAQSYNNAICFLWDHERDNYVNMQREVNTAFIQVTMFGVYLD